jgi:hypothetical protein
VKAALTFLVLLHAAIASAQAPAPLDSLAAPLLKARTYCETGKWGATIDANFSTEARYRICASSDGRFKYVENPEEPTQLVIWSDGRILHRYVEYGGGYQEYELSDRNAGYSYHKPEERTPALHSRLLREATRGAAGLDLLASLRDYRVSGELSDAQRVAYEFQSSDQRSSERIYVAAADGAFVRHERWYNGIRRGYVEVATREIDRPLSDSDISHQVPLLTRYSSRNNPAAFVAGLFILSAIAGLAFWTWMFFRSGDPESVVGLRRHLWRYFMYALASVAALLGLLAIATWGGSGHPPAIVYVLLMAVLAAIAFGLMAVFLLASYAGQVVARRDARL